MKILQIALVCFLGSVGFCSAGGDPLYDVADILDNKWPKIVDRLALDPLYLDDLKFSITTTELNGEFEAGGIIVDGISGVSVELAESTVNPIELEFRLSVGELKISSDDHKLTGRLIALPIKTKGKLRIKLKGVVISGLVFLNKKGKAVIKNLVVYVDIDKTVVNLEGARKIQNVLLSQIAPITLRRGVSKVVNDILKDLKNGPINDIISVLSIKKLTKLFKEGPIIDWI